MNESYKKNQSTENHNVKQQEKSNKNEKKIKSLDVLIIIGLILSIIRIPYLLNEAGMKYSFMTTEMFDIVMLTLGIVCIVTFVLSLILKRKIFIINLLSGLLLLFTGDILGNIIGILIIIDSIRSRK